MSALVLLVDLSGLLGRLSERRRVGLRDLPRRGILLTVGGASFFQQVHLGFLPIGFFGRLRQLAELRRDRVQPGGLLLSGLDSGRDTGSQTMRPAFGFLHACWAFPLTMLFTAHTLNSTEGDLHRFLTAYLDQQRSVLAGAAPDHARALELISDDGLRDRLAAAHHQALAL